MYMALLFIYWETLANAGALDQENLILARDLNLTLSAAEVWVQNERLEALANFFRSLFEQKKLIDLQPIHLEHTWKNAKLEIRKSQRDWIYS